MKLSKRTFRILLPALYFVVALFPIAGIIITIAESPNPFDFLFVASAPGMYLLDFIDRRLVRLPVIDGLFGLLPEILVNIGIYFLIGWVLDLIISHFQKKRHSDAL